MAPRLRLCSCLPAPCPAPMATGAVPGVTDPLAGRPPASQGFTHGLYYEEGVGLAASQTGTAEVTLASRNFNLTEVRAVHAVITAALRTRRRAWAVRRGTRHIPSIHAGRAP